MMQNKFFVRRFSNGIFLPLTLAMACGVMGCAGPGAQVTQCQKEKNDLLSQIEAERTKSQNLVERSAALEARLDQSEKQVAMLSSGGSSRWADNQPVGKEAGSKLASTANPRSTASGASLSPSSDLKWRNGKSPANTKSGRVTEDGLVLAAPAKEAARTTEATGQLEQMARRDRRLQYDTTTGLAKFQANVSFDGADVALSEEARTSLDELARYLKTADKDNLRIMVVGKPAGTAEAKGNSKTRGLGLARAQAVADYLDRHGISGDRLAITGISGASAGGAKGMVGSSNSPVEIYLAEPTTNIAGWGEVGRQRR